MSQIYVYSTLSNDQLYTQHRVDASGVPKPESQILIRGGANVMTKAFVTPLGVATPVTAEELVELKKNELFKLHMANGFITISDHRADADVVAADMTGRDESSPLVEQDDVVPAAEVAEPVRRSPGRPRKA